MCDEILYTRRTVRWKEPTTGEKKNILAQDDWNQSRLTSIYHAWWSRKKKCVAIHKWYYVLILHDVFQLLVGRVDSSAA